MLEQNLGQKKELGVINAQVDDSSFMSLSTYLDSSFWFIGRINPDILSTGSREIQDLFRLFSREHPYFYALTGKQSIRKM